MAMADYYLCNVCGEKCFYDANLSYEHTKQGELMLYRVGQMAAICTMCAKNHTITITTKGKKPRPVKALAGSKLTAYNVEAAEPLNWN